MIKTKLSRLKCFESSVGFKWGIEDKSDLIEITKITIFIGEGTKKLSPLSYRLYKDSPYSYEMFDIIEQKLSPTEQKINLYEKLKWVNKKGDNILIFTTHSPYILNALTLAIKAKGIKDQNIVPKESCIDSEDVSIYELTEDGLIRKLPMIDGLPSDNNYLNNHLAKSNQLFDRLLELEESCLTTI